MKKNPKQPPKFLLNVKSDAKLNKQTKRQKSKVMGWLKETLENHAVSISTSHSSHETSPNQIRHKDSFVCGMDFGSGKSQSVQGGFVDGSYVVCFDFSEALAKLKLGHKVSRFSWLYDETFVSLPIGINPKPLPSKKVWGKHNRTHSPSTPITVNPYLTLHLPSNAVQMGWLPSAEDLLATDWYTPSPTSTPTTSHTSTPTP